jgi:hypothetical protein
MEVPDELPFFYNLRVVNKWLKAYFKNLPKTTDVCDQNHYFGTHNLIEKPSQNCVKI